MDFLKDLVRSKSSGPKSAGPIDTKKSSKVTDCKDPDNWLIVNVVNLGCPNISEGTNVIQRCYWSISGETVTKMFKKAFDIYLKAGNSRLMKALFDCNADLLLSKGFLAFKHELPSGCDDLYVLACDPNLRCLDGHVDSTPEYFFQEVLRRSPAHRRLLRGFWSCHDIYKSVFTDLDFTRLTSCPGIDEPDAGLASAILNFSSRRSLGSQTPCWEETAAKSLLDCQSNMTASEFKRKCRFLHVSIAVKYKLLYQTQTTSIYTSIFQKMLAWLQDERVMVYSAC
jgi:hypothetical protein